MDLTKYFLNYSRFINEKEYIDFINDLLKIRDFEIDWDKEDGEQWGRIFYKDKHVAMFHSSIPIMFLCKKNRDDILRNIDIKNEKICVLPIDSWKEEKYVIEIHKLNGILDWHCEDSYELSFSLDDLYYSTI